MAKDVFNRDFCGKIEQIIFVIPLGHHIISQRGSLSVVYCLPVFIVPQPFYGSSSGTTWVSRCHKGTSGLYGARED